MARRRLNRFYAQEAMEFLNHVMKDKPLLPFLIPLGLFAWAIERWLVPFSNWVPLAAAVWATIQQVMRLGFDWDTNEMSVMMLAKLAKPLMGTGRIVINHIHIKGDLLLRPILDGQAVLYSFESTPEVRLGVAFGSGGSQALPATELPGVSAWLVKLCTETIVKRMVEPHRQCFSLPPVDLRKKAVGGVLSVTVISASNMGRQSMKSNNSETRQNSTISSQLSGNSGNKVLQTLIEVELGDLMRRTDVGQGLNPRWGGTFNMVLHGDTGILKFHLYEWDPSSVQLNYLTSYDSTIFWAIGHGSGVVAKQAEHCGKEVEMVVPFEEVDLGELTVRLVLREWQFSDGSISMSNSVSGISQPSLHGSPNLQLRTGRKLKVTVVEGRNLTTKDKTGKCDPYVKLQYGKVIYRTKTVPHTSNPEWDHTFEFDEIGGGEYLKIKCYSADLFGDDNIGSARVNLEGIPDASYRDVWIPLEKVNSGEVRLQIEALKNDDHEGLKNSATRYGFGWIELVLIEAKDLVAADLRGTSDPFVRVQYGNMKKRTKVVYKTLNPRWNQTLEFPDTGSPLILHVRDHNAVLPTSSIGHCVVEYQRLPPNQTADKWIPLQGIKSGEIHVRITRRVPELPKKSSLDTNVSAFSKAHTISAQIREILKKLQNFVGDGDLEGLSLALSEVESTEDVQEEYMLQLEREKELLIHRISELGREISRTSSAPSKISY
ncbi:synaptotagmin-5 [Cocos nucifera]|uniref:Synaptotagmin-5 n=1 Tax=Cocos nucifera TaxID=13894 RepID=A0A8K0I2S6_COCNU|nr:synaptotagmin-5 [Cocos nucifera]